MLNKDECISLIKECFTKKGVDSPENVGLPNMNLHDVDLCIDYVADSLCDEGFDEDDEPTPYGWKLEHVIDYLSRIRSSIVDGVEFIWHY